MMCVGRLFVPVLSSYTRRLNEKLSGIGERVIMV